MEQNVYDEQGKDFEPGSGSADSRVAKIISECGAPLLSEGDI